MIDSKTQNEFPLVYISLLNWMNFQDTIACVESILKLNYSNFSILILDNASPNDSYNRLKETFPDIQVGLSSENNGFAAGHFQNYLLAREMGAELFWILNSDLEVDINALSEIVQTFNLEGDNIYGSVSLNPKHPELVDFGGASYSPDSNNKLTYNNWKHKSYKDLIEQYPNSYEVESVEGSSMMIPIKVIEKCGFIKLDFFMYGEELDYCYRLRMFGVNSIIATKSIVYHRNEGSLQLNPRLKNITLYYRKRNFTRFRIEHFHESRIKLLFQNDTFYSLIMSIIKGLLSKNKNDSYYFSLGKIHAFFNVKSKKVKPEKLLKL